MSLTNRDKRKAREHAYLLMYQYDLSGLLPEEVLENYWEEVKEKEEVKDLAVRLFKGTLDNLEKVDREISKHLKKGWYIERLLPMDRSILRVSTYELMMEDVSPPEAVINDAVGLSKEYGEDVKSPAFINAVLDSVKRDVKNI
ncbi:MAG: transcription antitermination factor NusB [Desulfurobacteriaceae bacterium]